MPKTSSASLATATATLLLALAVSTLAGPPAEAEVLNRIVLRVNDRIATLYQYESRRARLLGELMSQEMSPDVREQQLGELGERVYRDLYEEMVILSRADQLGIEITEEQLNTVIEQITKDMNIPDQQTLVTALQESGLTLKLFREQWRQNLRMREVITREVDMPIEEDLKEEDLRRYYRNHPDEFRVPEQVHLREVVVLEDSELSADEQTELATLLHGQLTSGRTLEEAVEPYTETSMTSKVIDLGWIERGELDPALEEATFDLPAGSFSDAVRARGGLHLVEIVERKASTLLPFEEVSQRIRVMERRRLSNLRFPEYMKELEESSYVVLNPPLEAQGFRRVQGGLAEELPEMPEGVELGPEEGTEAPAQEGAAPPEQASPEPPSPQAGSSG